MRIAKYSSFEYISEEESIWGDIKYGFSKLGRYKAGGKIFGKGKTDREAAEEIGEIMGDASNALLKATYQKVKEVAPEFPNDRRRVTFLRGIILYGQLYDSIVAAAEKNPGEEGYLAPEVANKLIEGLRKVVKKALDVDLAAVYSVMDSNQNIDSRLEDSLYEEISMLEGEVVNEEFFKKLGELKDKAMDKLFGKKDEDSEPRRAGSRQSAKLQGAGDDGEVESERMKTLDSNKLPLILAGAGAALGLLGWIAQTEWFKDLVTKTVTHPDQWGEKQFTTTVEKNLKVDPKGWSYTIQNNGFMDATGKSLGPDQPISNLKDAFKFYGGGDEAKGIETMSKFLGGDNSPASIANLQSQLADPSNRTIMDVFNKAEGTWGDNFFMNQSGGAKSIIAKQVYTATKKYLIKKGFTTTTTSVIGGKLIALAPVLQAAGIALVAAGITVKLLREKGKRQSRAKTLNDLLQSLKLVKEKESSADPQEEGGSDASKKSEKSIYPVMIKNLKALQSMMISYRGVSLQDEGGSEEEKQHRDASKRKLDKKALKVGGIYTYTNKKGKQSKVKLISLTDDTNVGKDRKWLTKDDEVVSKLGTGLVSVIFKDRDGKYGSGSLMRAVEVEQLSESLIMGFEEMMLEKEFSKGPRNTFVGKEDSYATQALSNLRRSIKSFMEDKMKVDRETTIQEVIDAKVSSETKEAVKKLYANVYEFLFGKYSKTLSDVGPLYKESFVTDEKQNMIMAEKMARLYKRTGQFEGENLYSTMGELGEDLRDYNETMKEIMDYMKENAKSNESSSFGRIKRFDRF
jgi:hypothetical protein